MTCLHFSYFLTRNEKILFEVLLGGPTFKCSRNTIEFHSMFEGVTQMGKRCNVSNLTQLLSLNGCVVFPFLMEPGSKWASGW